MTETNLDISVSIETLDKSGRKRQGRGRVKQHNLRDDVRNNLIKRLLNQSQKKTKGEPPLCLKPDNAYAARSNII